MIVVVVVDLAAPLWLCLSFLVLMLLVVVFHAEAMIKTHRMCMVSVRRVLLQLAALLHQGPQLLTPIGQCTPGCGLQLKSTPGAGAGAGTSRT